MRIRKKFFPYPVLSYFNDDINGELKPKNIEVSLSNDKIKYNIEGTIQLFNRTIEEMLNDNTAKLVLHIECSKTRYREVFNILKDVRFALEVDSKFLEGNVELQFLIVSNKKRDNYINSDSHPDFENIEFVIEVGQILAVCEPISFFANKDNSKITNFPSIFSIIRNPVDKGKAIDYSLEDDKITILLSEENYISYRTLKNNSLYQPILSAMILVPVLSSLLYSLPDLLDEYNDSTWLTSIKNRMGECGLNFGKTNWSEDSLSIANILVGDPLSCGLTKIKEGED